MKTNELLGYANELVEIRLTLRASGMRRSVKLAHAISKVKVIEILRETKNPMREREIANALGVTQGAINGMLNRMKNQGILERITFKKQPPCVTSRTKERYGKLPTRYLPHVTSPRSWGMWKLAEKVS